MWRRQRSAPEAAHTEERQEKLEEKQEEKQEEQREAPEPPPESRRTRSGRRVRTPAALLDSEEPPRTPSRRTRRTVLLETNTEELSHVSAAPEPCTGEDPSGEHVPRPVGTVPTGPETVLEMVPTGPETVLETVPTGPETVLETVPTGPETVLETVPTGPETVLETVPTGPETVPKKRARLVPSVNQNPVVPLGKPKSGRVWKDRSKQRFSALVRDKPLCSSWEKKMQEKRDKEVVKRFSLQLKEDKAREKEEKRKRREDNLKRRADNERKSEIVQVIRNTAKIKRMKKKQLRRIEKRDTLALLQRTQSGRTKGQKKTDKHLT